MFRASFSLVRIVFGTHLCCRAIHRSPQDWNSYNTFLSDASEIGYTAKQTQSESSPVTAQLCHVLQGQQEIAQARELYANATMEKIALLKYLKKKDQDRLQRELKLEEYIEHQSTVSMRAYGLSNYILNSSNVGASSNFERTKNSILQNAACN